MLVTLFVIVILIYKVWYTVYDKIPKLGDTVLFAKNTRLVNTYKMSFLETSTLQDAILVKAVSLYIYIYFG